MASECYSCNTAQNFCASCQIYAELSIPGKQTIKGTDGFKKYDVITADLWEKTYNILEQLHNHGSAGNRNFPSQNTLDTLKNFRKQHLHEQITNELYVQLLNDISIDADGKSFEIPELKDNSLINIEDTIDKIQTFLDNYKIDFNRCNTCNATGNCSHCSHCFHVPSPTITPFFCFEGCGNSCSHGGSCSQCCMYGSPGSYSTGGDGSCP